MQETNTHHRPGPQPAPADAAKLEVFHDGSCPLCQREIAFFRRRVPPGSVAFVDVSAWQPGTRHHGLDRSAAMARFHVREPDGTTLTGARAFAALWRVTPGLRTVGRVAALPPLASVLEGLYRAFLYVRPWLQRLARGIHPREHEHCTRSPGRAAEQAVRAGGDRCGRARVIEGGAAAGVILSLCAAAAQGSTPQDDAVREAFNGSHRVLLIFSPDTRDPRAARLDAALAEMRCGVEERDLVIGRLPRDGEPRLGDRPLSPAAASRLREEYRIDDDGFTVILVGKDGGEKSRHSEVPDLSRIFSLIDGMPMRREEMRDQGSTCSR